MIDQAAWDRTVEISQQTKNLDGKTVLTKAPDAESYTNDIVNAALAKLAADSSFDAERRRLQEGDRHGQPRRQLTGFGRAAVRSHRAAAPADGRPAQLLTDTGRPARCCR